MKRQVGDDSVASCFISFGLWKYIDILISVFNDTFISDYQEKSVYEFHQNNLSVRNPFCDRSVTGYGFVCYQLILISHE
ncbi:hypothetical protein [Nostoc sp. 'Lobaria pulmonaria (5183) cyanobiont']|uniref:hypothetical protein n=1 Tax=Nostoc sp. 'Lobaria pulmonaria (5183) cyanobiont' TaxID=1618022 RepID=UPI001319D445|nr:hypothetical protein [Nostoc sp. 'Lobaria pulmonaria (5183) cyanobiont']